MKEAYLDCAAAMPPAPGIPEFYAEQLRKHYANQEAGHALAYRERKALEEAGAFAVVLECVPAALGERVTRVLHIPTIGIGSGAGCSGQVQVLYDLLGLTGRVPKHAKRYAELGGLMRQALAAYASEVKSGVFPAEGNTFK